MKITELQQNTQNSNLIDIFIDESYFATFSVQTVETANLSVGKEVDDDFITKLSQGANYNEALTRALFLLGFRDHTRKELHDKLVNKGFDEFTTQNVCDAIEKKGYINDLEYARRLADILFQSKNYGEKRVEQELYRRGVSEDNIAIVLSDAPDAVEKLKKLLEKRFYNFDITNIKERKKVISTLFRLGYRYDDIKRALCIFED